MKNHKITVVIIIEILVSLCTYEEGGRRQRLLRAYSTLLIVETPESGLVHDLKQRGEKLRVLLWIRIHATESILCFAL